MYSQRRNSLITYAVIGIVLVASGFAVVAFPALLDQLRAGGASPAPEVEFTPEPDMISIDIGDYLLGEELLSAPVIGERLAEFNGTEVPLAVVLILTGLTVAVTIGAGLPLAIIYWRLDRVTAETKETDDFQGHVAALETREKETINRYKEVQPPDDVPSHQWPRWSVVSTSLVFILFAMALGAMLSDTLVPGGELMFGDTLVNPTSLVANIFGLVALIVCLTVIRARKLLAVDETDYQTTDWGLVWVILSGVVFVGAGVGLMLLVRSMGSG